MSHDYPVYISYRIKKNMFHFDELTDREDSDTGILALFKYNFLFSIYSFPNFILPLIGGLIIDKIGVRTALVILSGLVALGTSICAFSGIISGTPDFSSDYAYYIMLIGRFIYAMGAESLLIA